MILRSGISWKLRRRGSKTHVIIFARYRKVSLRSTLSHQSTFYYLQRKGTIPHRKIPALFDTEYRRNNTNNELFGFVAFEMLVQITVPILHSPGIQLLE
jgi:hypothetical protein